jgi:hypothetical protein
MSQRRINQRSNIFIYRSSNSKSPEHSKKATEVKNRLNSHNKTKEKSPINNILKSSLHKKDANSLNLDQIIPLNAKINITKNNQRSPERKITNTLNGTTDKIEVKGSVINTLINNHHGDRNAAQRSISPRGSFNNTTNSLKAIQDNANNEQIIKEKDNSNNIRKSPVQTKNSMIQALSNAPTNISNNSEVTNKKPSNISTINTNINNCNSKREGKIIGSPTNKKEKSPFIINNICIEDKKKQKGTVSNNANIIKAITSDSTKKDMVKKETNEKIMVIKDKNNNESGNKKEVKKESLNSKTLNNFKTSKTVSLNKNNDELDEFISSKQNITEFACCTINNITEIQDKIRAHCLNNKISLKEVRI